MSELHIAPEVRRAVAERRPVVALETALVTHGLPAPRGLRTAEAAEAAVREAGAIPATTGVLDGRVIVGLSAAELERLAAPDSGAVKAGARDLAALAATGRTGSTTVSGMLAAAAAAGIRVASTGGIGGVHRGWSRIPDVSSDLAALGNSRVLLVSSGFKSILDTQATVEALETLAIPVIGYRTDVMPGFYVRETGTALEHRVDEPAQVAELLHLRWAELKQDGGVLLANPPPSRRAIPAEDVEAAVTAAMDAARSAGIRGKAVTPYLLKEVVDELGDRALEVNTSLIVGNARVAAEVATAVSERRERRPMGF